jgi:hypothetical protein
MADKNAAIESADNLKRIYVRGLNIKTNTNVEGLPISVLKSHLFRLRFRLSKIVNIAPSGGDFTEFIIHHDYENGFLEKCKACHLRTDLDYNPALPINPDATAEMREQIRKNFVARLRRSIERSDRAIVKEYYSRWLELEGCKEVITDANAGLTTDTSDSQAKSTQQSNSVGKDPEVIEEEDILMGEGSSETNRLTMRSDSHKLNKRKYDEAVGSGCEPAGSQ